MDTSKKTCKTCGHCCHCYGPECNDCSCEVCDCGKMVNSMEDVPSSFIKSNV